MDRYLFFGNVRVKTPSVVKLGNEKIWSQNTARAASGRMVGDIIAIKKTIHIEWAHATPEEVSLINSFISDISSAFFDVTFPDETFTEVTKTVYAGTAGTSGGSCAVSSPLTSSSSKGAFYVY